MHSRFCENHPAWKMPGLLVVLLAALLGIARGDQAPDDDVPLNGTPVGKPQKRTGAGARSGKKGPEVYVLSPLETGATIRSQPVLYWYLSADTDVDVEFSVSEAVTDDGKPLSPVTTLLTRKYEGNRSAGLYAVNLADEHVTLKPLVQYQITVTLHDDRDFTSYGFVELVPTPENLAADPDVFAYGKAGLWYDALESLVRGVSPPAHADRSRIRLCKLVGKQHVFFSSHKWPVVSHATGTVDQRVESEKKLSEKFDADEKKLMEQFESSVAAVGLRK